ncbi:MAG: NGG1p interacting factor NIF3 [Coriobacteriia bacterium]
MSIRLGDMYRVCVEAGIAQDARSREEIDRVLAVVAKEYDKLDPAEREFFDAERLTNPYADTRICAGGPDFEIRGLLVGIDMEVGEVLLADRLREKGAPIDLIFAHHPEGPGFANLHEVMYMQADLWARQGVSIAAGDSLIAPRAQEIRRRFMPINHYRAIQAAELLGFASLSCHTPADNSVNAFVQDFLDDRAPQTLDDCVAVLREIPEYADAARKGYGPAIVQGTGCGRAGRMVADMTGGTEGPIEALDKLVASGVGTLVGMHYSEEHRKHAEEIKLNLVVAGHISSDTLGMNLILDEIEKVGTVEIVCASGMIRVKRS